EQCIRGHYGTVVFNQSTDGFDFVPERPQVTRLRDQTKKHISTERPKDDTYAHWVNFLDAIAKGDQQACKNPPDLGAAATTTITMGAESYRFGKVLEWNKQAGKVVESSDAYARQWEKLSHERGAPRHIIGWDPVNKDPMFSRQRPESWQKLEGPWKDNETD